jgi:hypothetical protein
MKTTLSNEEFTVELFPDFEEVITALVFYTTYKRHLQVWPPEGNVLVGELARVALMSNEEAKRQIKEWRNDMAKKNSQKE